MANQPILLNSCAVATTAKEAAFRIAGRPRPARATRVIALDAGAQDVVRPFIDEPWRGARFLTLAANGPDDALDDLDDLDDLVLTSSYGEAGRLSEELDEADFVMMVGTDGSGAAAASAIGTACTLRGIMTAGLIVGSTGAADAAVVALRPHARVLLVTGDGADVHELLSAVGA
jgi:hypothetical protein